MAELTPIPFDRLLRRIFYEFRKSGSIFDLPSRKFYRPDSEYDLAVDFLGKRAANPAGPAAGPHTQLAQNIVLAWLAGSRILELKTVQIKDRLELTRPCIDMATIGYNTEWSQELLLDQSLREYVKASMIIEILKHWIFLSDENGDHRPEQFDTILDLSVGYDLAGIRSAEIRAWLDAMRDASTLIEEYRDQIPEEFSAYRGLDFNPEIGSSITLSTFHGTKADEIESICRFLIAEMDFDVVIKMNPPMLGKERLEYLLHDRLGFSQIEVNENAYKVNIAYADAVQIVARLQESSRKIGKKVGVKFGNTLEVVNHGSFLKDKIQYLSGQPLHVLHLELVNEWRKSFGPDFPISFSAGVDANNFADCVSIGLVPVTSCTDLLRPAGYGRLQQYLKNLEAAMNEVGAKTVREFIIRTGAANGTGETADSGAAVLSNTAALLKRSIENPRYHHDNNSKPPRKVGSHLSLWDCLNCSKCIPVCPNNANFYLGVEPVDREIFDLVIKESGWTKTNDRQFRVQKDMQIANFADACNDCGNCDVFCPEDGGPYVEKPRFFGSIESFGSNRDLDGFYFDDSPSGAALNGRIGRHEFRLEWDSARDRFVFRAADAVVETDAVTHEIVRALPIGPETAVVDMTNYHVMTVLLKGMSDTARVNYLNVEAHRRTAMK